jgi:integrase
VLHRALNYGIRPLKVLKQNAASEVPAPRPIERLKQPMQQERIQILMEMAKGTRLEVPVALTALTGLRRGEVLALRWQALDFDRGLLVVNESLEQTRQFGLRFKGPQSRSSHRVLPLATETLSILREYKMRQDVEKKTYGSDYMDNDLVFANPDGSPWPPDTLTQQFSALAKSVGMKGFRFHDLRHAFATLMLKDGGSVKEVSLIMGHSTTSLTLQTYAHSVEGMGGRRWLGLPAPCFLRRASQEVGEQW